MRFRKGYRHCDVSVTSGSHFVTLARRSAGPGLPPPGVGAHSGGMQRSVAVLLGAGGGTRFRGATHKLLATLRGRPVYHWAVEHAREAGLEVWVVTGAATLEPIDGVRMLHNPRWAEGQATSLQCAVQAAAAEGLDAITVGLADQPFVTASTWHAVSSSTSPIAVASYDGTRGNPVRLAASIWHLLPAEGDLGARSLMHDRPDLVEDIDADGSSADIDTLEDLARWNS